MRLHIPVGIPGCGKSTFAKNLATTVSSDQIREAMGDINDQSKNKMIFEIFYDRIETFLGQGFAVFADATNLDTRSRNQLCEIAQRQGAKIHLILFRNLEQAICRNDKRERKVPSDVMLRMIEKYERAIQQIQHEDYDYITEVSATR